MEKIGNNICLANMFVHWCTAGGSLVLVMRVAIGPLAKWCHREGGGDWHCGDGYSSGNCTWAKIVLFNRKARMTEVTATTLSPFSTRVVNVLTWTRHTGKDQALLWVRSGIVVFIFLYWCACCKCPHQQFYTSKRTGTFNVGMIRKRKLISVLHICWGCQCKCKCTLLYKGRPRVTQVLFKRNSAVRAGGVENPFQMECGSSSVNINHY